MQFAFQGLEDGHCAGFLVIDYSNNNNNNSKVFDRVDVTVALHELLQMDARQKLVPWIGDFLSRLREYVRVKWCHL